MDRADLIAQASPPCHYDIGGTECGSPVQRVEMGWGWMHGDHEEDSWWHVASMTMVCAAGHRVAVERVL